MQNGRKERDQIVVRVPSRLTDLIDQYLERDAYMDTSELVRNVLRERIREDAPELYRGIFREGNEDGRSGD
ncbi:hypothetical protein AKJ66_04460 [candidate division MSBL1 archaeon SCGC-AAA259E22]|uniref:Ribbon-helix-helix protein CopG domain-containing protein n=1 Tax=candidate division MSBL1 archaeon SCGC-AAA259E22 TaxID=1698265 RepID=A0A133UDI8_9EURY|nr:hypothetical protein AKJ66_04460 [candidate division MSBL1 archaeon SCGC-AAA259E22]